VIHTLALEAANNAIKVFTSAVPWGPRGPVPTINGRTLSEGYAALSSTQVSFNVAPNVGDEVGFFITLT
jgi:hypothetical protein